MTASRASAGLVLLAVVALCAALGLYARGWPSDNRVQVWTRAGVVDPGYDLLRERFGGDEIVLLRADRFQAQDERARAWLDALGERSRTLGSVRRVVDPLHLAAASSRAADRDLSTAAAQPVVAALDLVDAGAPRVDLVLAIDPDAVQVERTRLASALVQLEAEAQEHGVRLRSAGHPLIAAELDREGRRVEEVFAPLLALAALLATSLALRSLALGAIAVLAAVLASVGTRAGLRAVGWDSNLILVSVGPLTFVIVLASVLHALAGWQRLRGAGLDAREASRRCVRGLGRPSLLAAVTTAFGFGVFVLTPIQAVQRLGAAVAAAVCVFVPVAFLGVPWLLARLDLVPRAAPDVDRRRWRSVALAAVRWRILLVAVSIAVTVAGAVAAVRLPRNTDGLTYFPEGHRVREAFLAIEREGGAPTTIDVLLRWHAPLALEAVLAIARAGLAERLGREPGVRGVFGPEAVLAQVEASAGPFGAVALPGALREAERSDGERTTLRWTVRVASGGAEHVEAAAARLLASARAWSGEARIEPAAVEVAGTLLRIQRMQSALTTTLFASLGLSLAVTTILFLTSVKSARELLAALLANLFPVGSALAAAWALGLQIDAATVMVSSVVLGLSVDSAFHLFHAAGEDRGRASLRRIARAFERTGRPVLAASLALALGFAVLSLSGFRPTARFGGLAALGIAAGLLGTLLALPAVWADRRGRMRARSRRA